MQGFRAVQNQKPSLIINKNKNNMKRICLIFFVILGLIGTSLYAQDRRVTGTVTDMMDGSSLPGVTVRVKGTNIGTQTDNNGRYEINVPQDGVLVFSFIGMSTEEIAVGERNVINVSLSPDIAMLQEVVITGLGAATDRRRVAISVETVSESELTRVPNRSIDGALIGRIAGAQIQSTSGQPGQQANIILRGINTLSSTQPMILIDGVEINAGSNSLGLGNVSSRLADLDLSNVERIEVVQGAAAATIYGAQGANGVIQIFTKRGRRGQRTDIRFASTYSFDNALRGNLEFAKFHYYPTDADGFIVAPSGNRIAVDSITGFWSLPAPGFTAATVNNKPFMEPTFDHRDQYFIKNAGTFTNSLNIVGAAEKIDYSFGLSQLKQESVVNGKLTRYNLTSNIGAEIFRNFTIRANTQLISSENTTGGINNRNNVFSGMSNALMVPQFVDLSFVTQAGYYPVIYDQASNSVNPFYSYQFRDYEANLTRVIQGVNANYKLTRNFELDYRYGVDHYRYDYLDFIKNQTVTATPARGITPINGQMLKRRVQETQQNSILSAIARFDFERDFAMNLPIQSTTQFAYDWRRRDYHMLDGIGTGFDVLPPHTFPFAATTDADEFIEHFVTFGYLVNQKFDYGLLGGFSAGFRSDFSSEFGEGSKPFTFPRADAYFRLSEVLNLDYIYEMKLRFAYGEAGIQPAPYSRLVTLNAETLGNANYMFMPPTARNPLLSVENTKEFELGLDYGFFTSGRSFLNKASGSLVYWTRNSYGSIFTIGLAPSTGATGIFDNAIDLKSEGIQFSLDVDVVTNTNFVWSFGTRFSKGLTMVDRISNGLPLVVGAPGSGQTSVIEGEPVGAFFGFKPLSSLDETNSAGVRYIPVGSVDNFEVVNGMVVNKANKQVQFTSEQFKIGDATPKFSMSFFNDFTIYRNLSVSAQIDWVYGAQAYNQTRQWLYRDRLHSDFDKEVTIDGETGAFVAFWSSLYNTNRPNSFFVEDASFIRLRNVALSYDLSKHLPGGVVKGLVLSVSGSNLFTITDYTGVDPEATGTNLNNPLNRGTDLWSFPNMRTYSFSLNVNF